MMSDALIVHIKIPVGKQKVSLTDKGTGPEFIT